MIEGLNETDKQLLEIRDRQDWRKISAVLTQLHNVNCADRSKLIKNYDHYNPYEKQSSGSGGIRLTRGNVCEVLGAAFGKRDPNA